MGAGLRRSLKGGAKPKRGTRKSTRKGGMFGLFGNNNNQPIGERKPGMFSRLTGMVGNPFNSATNSATNSDNNMDTRNQSLPPQPRQYGGRRRRGKKRSRDSHTRKRKGGKTRKTHGTRRRR
jgi:hypothetical protein